MPGRYLAVCLFALLKISPAFADHEPFEYFFAAKRNQFPTRHFSVFPSSSAPYAFPDASGSDTDIAPKLDDLLNGEPRVALGALAVSKGKIVYEKYLHDTQDNLYPSWSMAKSLTSLSVGYALCDGKIASLDDPAGLYAEVLRGTVWGEASIRSLLTMSSGASAVNLDPVDGDYTFQSRGLSYALSRNVYTLRQAFRLVGGDSKRTTAGTVFSYNNMDTEALAAVVAGATRSTFQDYFNRRIWQGLSPEHRAVWLLDSDQQALASAYFFASMRDYAKVAQHLIDIHKGRTGGECLRDYVRAAVSPQKLAGGRIWYGYQFWIYGARGDFFGLWGHQGQEIIVSPATEKFVVLTAHRSSIRGKVRDPKNLFPWLKAE